MRNVVISCVYRPHIICEGCWCHPDEPYPGVHVHKALTLYNAQAQGPKMAVFSDQYQRGLAPGG